MIIQPNQEKALFFAKRQLVELVFDAVNLEGIHYTLPEVQTLLDGVTVGGRQLQDQMITLNQRNAWLFLFDSIERNQFALTQAYACQLHVIAAKEEALTWGQFRDDVVTIAGTTYQPPNAEQLNNCWDSMMSRVLEYHDIYEQSIAIFLQMARHQFFYDVNKRMGRFMMNGHLLQHGFPAINLPAARQLEFNTLMLAFYQSNDMRPMFALMKDCLSPTIIRAMSQ